MSQGWRSCDIFHGIISGTTTIAIVVMHQQAVIASTFNEVRQIASPITVMISNQVSGGSGVIVAKKGNTYTVLTNRHVVEEGKAYQVKTSDQTAHERARVIKSFQDVDLAVLQFESPKVYPVATIGDSSVVSIGDTIFSFGFPGVYNDTTKRSEQTYYDAEGIILSLDAQQNQGYIIKHRADTPRGMSGGPSFDAKGRLIAINGRHGESYEWSTKYLFNVAPELDPNGEFGVTGRTKIQVQTYNGEWFSIPINTVLKNLSQAKINLPNLKIDKTPPPNNRQRVANPQNAGDFYLRGSISDEKGDLESAVNDYSQAIKLDSNSFDAYMSRGLALMRLGEWKQGSKDFTEVITRRSGNLKVVAYMNRGIAYARLGDQRSAIADQTQSIKLNPDLPFAYVNRGAAYFDIGNLESLKSAVADYEQAIHLDKTNATAYNNLGNVLGKLNEWKKAIQAHTIAIQLNPQSAAAYYNRGLTRVSDGDRQGAIDDYTQAIRLDSRYVNAYNNRGILRDNLGDSQGAIDDYTQAIRFAQKYAAPYNNRAFVLSRLKDYQGAMRDYDEAIHLNSKYTLAYYGRGYVRSVLEDYQGALEDYNQVIRLDPRYLTAEMYRNRGLFRTKLKDDQGALEDYSQAIRLDPKYADNYGNRGAVRENLGDRQGAIEDLQKAATLFLEQKNFSGQQQALDLLKKLQAP